MAKVAYICSRAPSLIIKVGNTHHQAANGILSVDEDVAEEIEKMMETRPDIRGMLRKVDLGAAAAQVRKHQAAQGPAAVKGPFTSVNPASEAQRIAKEAQTAQALTGSPNPVNTNANPPAPPADVQEIRPQETPSGSILDRMKNGNGTTSIQ